MSNATQAIETFPQFDLSNPQHLAMRKVMAGINSRHAAALEDGVLASAARYRGMAMGLSTAAHHVLNDQMLYWLCFELTCSLEKMEELYQMRAAA